MAQATLTPPPRTSQPSASRAKTSAPSRGSSAQPERAESLEAQGGVPEVAQEESLEQEVQDPGNRSTNEWRFWFILATLCDLVSMIPVVGMIVSPIAVWIFRYVFRNVKPGKKGVGFKKSNLLLTALAFILSIIELDPTSLISAWLPSCLAIVFTAYIQEKAGKKIKESLAKIAPAARGIEKAAHYAKYIPGFQEAAVVEAAAAGVARTGEGVAQGESMGQATAAGAAEGVQKGASGFMPGGGGAAASSSAGAASSSVGVGAQYGAGASQALAQGGPQKDQSIFEKVKARSEQEGSPYAEGEPIATKGLYADVPEETAGAKKDQTRKIKPRTIGGQL